MSTLHRFEAMGCEAVVAGASATEVAAALERWESTFSLYRPGSELSRVNCSRARVLAVSALFAQALRCALDAAAETGGLVDPTLGRGLDRVRLTGRVLVRPPEIALDLNGVVKALAVDEAAGLLERDGFVSVGGDVAVRGPVDVGLPGGGAVRVERGGLATSGTATRGRHLVDPRTGRPSDSPWRQVTVSGASCFASDVAAKAAFLLGELGPRWLDERRMAGRFVDASGEVLENGTWSRALAGAAACT